MAKNLDDKKLKKIREKEDRMKKLEERKKQRQKDLDKKKEERKKKIEERKKRLQKRKEEVEKNKKHTSYRSMMSDVLRAGKEEKYLNISYEKIQNGQTKVRINLMKATVNALKKLSSVKIKPQDIPNLGIVDGPVSSEQKQEKEVIEEKE